MHYVGKKSDLRLLSGVYGIIVDIAELGLKYEPLEESNEFLCSTTERYTSHCQIVEEQSNSQMRFVVHLLIFILIVEVGIF